MLEAICFECHVKEHRAERIHQNKVKFQKEAERVKDDGEPGAGKACTPGSVGRMQKRTL